MLWFGMMAELGHSGNAAGGLKVIFKNELFFEHKQKKSKFLMKSTSINLP